MSSQLEEVRTRLAELKQRVDGLVGTVGRPGWSSSDATERLDAVATSVDRVVVELDALHKGSVEDAAHLDEILEVLFGMAGLDFSLRATVGDKGGRLDALAASCNMLSEELEASQQAIEKQNRELRAATEAKSQFLAHMSHEIRTPLGAMLGFADLLLESDLTDSERLNCAHVIRRNGEHLLAVINDILDLSKIEAGKLAVEHLSFSLAQLVCEVESLMRVRASEKGLSFEILLKSAVPAKILSDPMRVRQILLNLIGNAVKFTEDGEVRVEIRYEPGEPGQLSFDVIDTGIGMTPEALSHLFSPFEQGDASMSRRFGGTGLGLAICRPLAEALEGEISVESVPGRGSRFRLQMAVQVPTNTPFVTSWHDAALQRRSQSATSTRGGLTGTVLVAEDGVDNQILITSILRRAGLKVVVADNGALAVERVLAAGKAGTPFDLIIMDMQMPELDGYGATTSLRECGYKGPIVALTAHAMAGERERCIAAGCDDYLSKPFERQQLISMIEKHLGHAGQKRTPQSEFLTSSFQDDPEMIDLINRFVESLPDRVKALRDAESAGDRDVLRRLAHHLKGAAGGYGFQPITEAAGVLEQAATGGSTSKTIEALEKLAHLCAVARRVEMT